MVIIGNSMDISLLVTVLIKKLNHQCEIAIHFIFLLHEHLLAISLAGQYIHPQLGTFSPPNVRPRIIIFVISPTSVISSPCQSE